MVQTGKNAETNMPNEHPDINIMETIINFLKLFMPETLVKRVLSIVLISAGLENSRVTGLTGYCDRSVRTLRKEMAGGDISKLLTVGGGGRKGKTAGIEDEISAELERGNYHTRQQIADMIYDKFHISISPSAVGKLLKKRVQTAEKWFLACQSGC